MKHLGCLIALITLPLSIIAAPKYPFPQNAAYKYGIIPADVNSDKVQEAYEDFMELYEEQGDLARIKHDDVENSVSEGIAYGMMVLVYMDNETNNTQPKFDKLWNYYKKFSGSIGGLMSWRIKGFEGVANPMMDKNAATDAELDAAIALLQAYKQWEDEKYLTDAKELLAKIEEHEVNENGYLKPGDAWDTEKNVSYFSTGALEVFKEASEFDWEKVIQNSYSLIKKVQNSTTGLVPDWCSEDGTPSGGSRGNYYYDATRTPWRIAWAYSWYGHQDAKDICTKIASWITTKTNNDPENIVTGYSLDGNETDEWHNSTFVGPFVCAGMVDASHQDWVNKGFTHLSELEEDVYYQISLKFLTMLYLSGNMPNFWTYNPISTCPENKTKQLFTDDAALSFSHNNNSSLRISFSVATPGDVSIDLYTVLGKQVISVANGSYATGTHHIAISSAMTTGTYIVRMKTGTGMITQQILVSR